ncbi:MAG: hypothetical protein OXF93_20035 [Acidobacteria bacterium]|nr:hypothetical protein [Acidobacteriota bacterium]
MPKRGDGQPAESDRPVVRLKPHSYQPSKAELEAEIELPPGTTPEDLARAAVMPVTVVEE